MFVKVVDEGSHEVPIRDQNLGHVSPTIDGGTFALFSRSMKMHGYLIESAGWEMAFSGSPPCLAFVA